ncbi:N-formylglutamate amidohydrolase [Phaeovulum sp.]|uniref:N-formylglutamate amidohydrolase n=1 Tax=Phaeovulum sp. TaxID=2934796 RepID=UPI0039E56238
MSPFGAAPFQLRLPRKPLSGVVFASPHSGRNYPADFLRRTVLDERQVRSSEDAFVDQLLESAPEYGAPMIAALAPRAWLDLNRGADELDPALIEGIRPQHLNPRISAGLGVIPRVVAAGRLIYSGKISRAEAEARIESVWRPYHAALARLLGAAQAEFGQSILIDVHSMPHEALEAMGPKRPEIVLGDRYGAAAGKEVMAAVEAAFAAEGLRVSRNAPFAGAYITQTYGRPSHNRHAIQVEIDRALYMNERTVRPSVDFDAFAAMMGRIIGRICMMNGAAGALAAE